MGKTVKITCDGCGSDLTTTGNCDAYRLHLSNERIPSAGGFVTMMGMYPVLESDLYVCSVACLIKVVEPLKATA